MTFVLKHIHVRDLCVLLEPLIAMLRQLSCQPESIEYKSTLLHYLLDTGDTAEPKVFLETIEKGLSTPEGGGVMTIASRPIDIGVEKGIQQGVQQGIKQGVQQAQILWESQFLVSLLERKFGAIPSAYRRRIEQASSEQLLAWGTKFSEVKSLSALFEEAEITAAF